MALPCFLSASSKRVRASLEEGFGRRSDGKTLADFDIAPTVSVVVGDDAILAECRSAEPSRCTSEGGRARQELL